MYVKKIKKHPPPPFSSSRCWLNPGVMRPLEAALGVACSKLHVYFQKQLSGDAKRPHVELLLSGFFFFSPFFITRPEIMKRRDGITFISDL